MWTHVIGSRSSQHPKCSLKVKASARQSDKLSAAEKIGLTSPKRLAISQKSTGRIESEIIVLVCVIQCNFRHSTVV